ncbi:MAG TPA: RidA family protein [Bacteroidia bacterium]
MTPRKIILTKNAPQPIGPYSQAIMHGNSLYVSGQIAINPSSGQLDLSSIENETHLVMENLKAIVEAAEMSMSNVVKATIFLSDMKNFSKVNEVYGSYFNENPPARETVQVSALPKNVNVEISVIAIK